MEPSITVILAASLGGLFAVAIITVLVAAKRKKTATDKHLGKGPIRRTDGDGPAGAVAPLSLAAGTESARHDGPSTGSYSSDCVGAGGSK